MRLGRSVAVKLFRNRAGAHSDRRCGDEARLLATLNHPGLVDVFDAGWHDDREFLVLQLVEGRTLGRRIAGGPLPAEDVVRIGAVLAEALHHVHERGIVHRDVKPSNVLCADDGGVFLTDFGISHPTGAEGVDRAGGVVVGTAPYLAPEQVQGGPIGPPCDVYALGLVLLECLTGKREYPGSQIEAAMARLHREPMVPEHAPVPLGQLIRSMTSLDPGARPSAAECRTALATDASAVDLAAVVAEVPALADDQVFGNGIDHELDEDELRRISAELPTAAVVLNLPAASGLPEPHPGTVLHTHRRPSGAHRRRRGSRTWNGVGATLGSALWPALHREPAPEARAS
jgi:serine/threonine protein kinase